MSSSAHIARGSNGAVTHNSRETFSHSVICTDEKNEIENNAKEAFSIYRKVLAPRMQAYEERTKQSLQKSTSTHLSCVVNLQQHHTLKDLEGIKKHIEKTFDTKVFQMAIHRDEGKLVSKEDEKEIYTSGVDFFKCPKTDKLFWDKKYTKEVDITKFNIEKNYHAHLEFVGLDSKGNSIKRNYLSKYNLSKLQTVTAQELKMERGKNYYESGEKAPKRLDVLEFKQQNKQDRQIRAESTRDLKVEYEAERAALKASGQATQQDYKDLKAKYDKDVAHFKTLYETNSKTVETYKTLYTNANDRADRAEAKKVVKEVEKVVEVEKIVKVQDNTRIEELETALKSTNAKLEDVESSNRILGLEMSVIAPRQEKEGFFVYARRIFYELKDKITTLTAKVSVLEKENAELKIANKNAIKAEMDKLVSTPKVQTALAKTQTPKEQEKVLEKEGRIEDLEKHISKLEKRIVGLKEDIGYAEHALRCTQDRESVRRHIDHLRNYEGMNWAEKKHAIWAKGEAIKMMEERLDGIYQEKIQPHLKAQKDLEDLEDAKSKVESEIRSCQREIKDLQKPQEQTKIAEFNKEHEEEHYYQGRSQ